VQPQGLPIRPMMASLGHTGRVIDVLKVDIERSEFEAFADPDFFGGDFVHDMSSLFTSNGDINWRYNVERQSSGEQKDTREMSLGFNLCELCSYNRFIRKKAARYFYHCLVLLGAGIIEAAQDKCIPYGEIHIRYRRVDSQSI